MFQKILKHPLSPFVLFAFLVFSWPFINFPLTDGDIAHWVGWAKEIGRTGHFLSAQSDQTHGPLMAWFTAPFSRLFPLSFYVYNLFNLLCGVLGVVFTYYFSLRFWKRLDVAKVASFFYVTSLVVVYMSRTPMYDWPAAIFYFGFCGFYYLHVRNNSWKDLTLAILCIGIASLSRFSISLGLGGFYMLIVSGIFRRKPILIIRDGALILLAGAVLVGPWVIVQKSVFGDAFTNEFLNDNIRRFISDHPTDIPRRDYYGFLLYALIGVFPYTFSLVASLVQKGALARLRGDKTLQVLAAGFMPCLLIFSFSGHVKLARYISYVFPFLLMYFSFHYATFDSQNASYRKSCGRFFVAVAALFTVLLIILGLQFSTQASQSPIFVVATAGLVICLILSAYFATIYRHQEFLENPAPYLLPFGLIYIWFFSALALLAQSAPFLIEVKTTILHALGA